MAKKHKNLKNINIAWNGNLDHPDAGNKNQSIPTSVDLGKWGGGTWWEDGNYVPDYTCPLKHTQALEPQCYWEDYDVMENGLIDVNDIGVFGDTSQYGTYLGQSAPNPWLTCLSTQDWGFDPVINCTDIPGLDQSDNSIDGNGYLANIIVHNHLPEVILPPKASETYGIDQSKIYSNWTGFVPTPNYTWGDVSFLIEIADGLGTGSRRSREARLDKFDDEKKKKLIHLICRVKGEKVYDEKKEVGDIQIKLEDAELVIKEVLGKMRVENTNVL